MGCWTELERVDAELSVRSREEAALRLRLGQVLEVASRSGAHFALGFSSIGAYALERGERSARWVESARCLARRLEGLPQLRRAVATGHLSWSMGELLARVAGSQDKGSRDERSQDKGSQDEADWIRRAQDKGSQDEGSQDEADWIRRARDKGSQDKGSQDEADWIRRAQGRTLREVRLLCEKARPASDVPAPREGESASDESERCTLTFTVDREESWLFESTRALLEAVGTRAVDEQVEALLAEGQDTLLAALPRGALELEELDCVDQAHERWQEQLRRWRDQAEELCEQRIRGAVVDRGKAEQCEAACVAAGVASEAALGCVSLEGKSAQELDSIVRALASAFAAHELELARLILRLHRMDGWRRLGYATEGQYARERLGVSRSSLLARRALAVRLERLPQLAKALSEGRVGVEAALQIARIATPRTEVAWVARARQRTVKHLREEVTAALIAVRLSGEQDCPPPFAAELDAYHELERSVLSGRVYQNAGEHRQSNESTAGIEHPAASQPVPPQAATAQAATAQAATAQAATAQATTSQAVALQPAASQAATSQAATSQAVALQPAASQPASGEPVALQPVASQPASAEPVIQQPASAQPASGEPVALQPAASQPASAQPASAQPVAERSVWAEMLRSLECWLERGVQFSAAGSGRVGRKSSAGRITLRLRVSRATRAWWHALESQASRWLPRDMSWLKFLCLSLWGSWGHLLGVNVAYGRIYIRDRHRCSSPVCSRGDVTPHHLKFRSAGGGEEDENLASLCTWCHLFGVHGGRIRAHGNARGIRWELGSREHPCVLVEGRERLVT